jgi:transposase
MNILFCFIYFLIDYLSVTVYKILMRDATYFTKPSHDWQRRYEALRASFVERLPAKVVADRFGYSVGYVYLLCHQFRAGKIDFSEPVPEGKTNRRRVTSEVRQKIISWRNNQLSAGEITELLSEDGIEISIRTIERVLTEEGFPKLPRRTRLKLGQTVKKADIPERSQITTIGSQEGCSWNSAGAGIFLFAPFLSQLNIDNILKSAALPGSKMIPARNYFLSFLALKLLGNERYAHVGDHAFDPGLGLFAGLNTIPKCTALSTYAYSLDEVHLLRLQKSFVKQASKLRLYKEDIINLDFHTVPHFGDESVLEKHWAGARNKRMKGALALFAQDAESKLILYTGADIKKDEADDQVFKFLSFWKGVRRGVKPTLVFDSKFTSYSHLSALDEQEIKFITLRRRGKRLLEQMEKLASWKRITIPHAKRKYPNPLVHDSKTTLRGYNGEIRQVVIRGNGHEKPTFLVSNDHETPVELLVGNYARRWRVENGIAEAVKFFNLNAFSSPILVKVQFDVIMTMIADTLYSMLAQKLRGFESCDAPKLNRHFVKTSGNISIKSEEIKIVFPRRAHNPILRAVPWNRLPQNLPWLDGARLNLCFK